MIRAGHSTGTAADYRNLEAVRRRDCRINGVVRKCVFIKKFLNRADRNRLRARVQNASAFTETFLRTDATTDFGHVAGGARQLCRFKETAVCYKGQPYRDPVAERTCVGAWRVRAINATAGLLARGGFVVEAVDLVEVADAFGGRAFRRHFTRDVAPVMFCRPRVLCWFHVTFPFKAIFAPTIAAAMHCL